MKNNVNFRFRDFNSVAFCKKIYESYGEDYLYSENLSFRNMSMDDLRRYVTVFNQLDYDSSDARQTFRVISGGKDFVYDYDKKTAIQDKLNKEFDKRYNDDIVTLYKFIDQKVLKNEKWLGERRYIVFDYHVDVNYGAEFRTFLLAYRLYNKCQKIGIKISDIIDICKMMSSGSSASYLYNGELDEHKVSKKVLFAHQMIENPDEDYEEILNF